MNLIQYALISLGIACMIRSVPGRKQLQARLERSWTRGKPLSCWVCLLAWSGLGWGLANGFGWQTLVNTLATIGMLAVPLEVVMPLPKESR